MKRLVLFVMVAVLLYAPTVLAQGDTNSTFFKATGSVLAAQHQDIEDVSFTYQLDLIRRIPLLPWHIYGMGEYSRVEAPGEDGVDLNAHLIVFSGDPNGPERDGTWVGFVTFGDLEFYDNDQGGESRLVRTNTGGSLGVIGPILGINWVFELGAQRRANSEGKMETYLSFGLGFMGVPKIPVKL